MAEIIEFQAAKAQMERRLWLDLLEQAEVLLALWPWGTAEPTRQFAYIPQGQMDPVYFRCVQRDDGAVCLLVHPSEAANQNFLQLQEASDTSQQTRLFIESAYSTLTFLDAEELPEEAMAEFQRLDLDPGAGLCPYLRCKRMGALETAPERQDLESLLDALGHFLVLFGTAAELHLLEEADPEAIFLRHFDPSERSWVNMTVPPPPGITPHYPVQVQDSPELERLRQFPPAKTVTRLEFDFGWIPEAEADEPQDPFLFPNVVFFTDRLTGEVLSASRCQHRQLVDCVFTLLAEIIEAHGRPEVIYLRRDASLDIIEGFASLLGIQIKQVIHLPATKKAMTSCGAV